MDLHCFTCWSSPNASETSQQREINHASLRNENICHHIAHPQSQNAMLPEQGMKAMVWRSHI